MDLNVTPEQLDTFFNDRNRPLVQDLFPLLTSGEREFLISGVTPEEWTATFGTGGDFSDLMEDDTDPMNHEYLQ